MILLSGRKGCGSYSPITNFHLNEGIKQFSSVHLLVNNDNFSNNTHLKIIITII